MSKPSFYSQALSFLIPVSFIIFISFGSCTSDNAETLYPEGACDTTNVTFSGTILQIIENNCFECHAGNPPSSGKYLGDYPSISAAALIPAGQLGSLYGAITHNANNLPMPQDRPRLSDCDISKIKAWIDAGAPDN
jgi:hypothetical protein